MTHSLQAKRLLTGSLILAGGQGTRLGIPGPKGCVTLPLKEKKTLFQLLLEKVTNKKAPLAIMTSPLNHEATLTYLEKMHFFGLENVRVFQQEMQDGFPDGNGKAFTHFYRLGIWNEWANMGIKFVQVLPVDNPLAIPFDAELIKANQGVELALRVVKLKSFDEKIGRVLDGKTLQVVEYSEQRLPHHARLGNTGIFSCTMDFIDRVYHLTLPIHIIKKKINGHWISKKESFIFDLFPHAKTFNILISERSRYFAPLKNRSGSDSFETVIRALAR